MREKGRRGGRRECMQNMCDMSVHVCGASVWCICVYVEYQWYICVVCVCAGRRVQPLGTHGSWRRTWPFFLYHSALSSWGKVFRCARSLSFWLGWLGRKLSGSACLCPPSAGIIGICSYTQVFTWVLEDFLFSLSSFSSLTVSNSGKNGHPCKLTPLGWWWHSSKAEWFGRAARDAGENGEERSRRWWVFSVTWDWRNIMFSSTVWAAVMAHGEEGLGRRTLGCGHVGWLWSVSQEGKQSGHSVYIFFLY